MILSRAHKQSRIKNPWYGSKKNHCRILVLFVFNVFVSGFCHVSWHGQMQTHHHLECHGHGSAQHPQTEIVLDHSMRFSESGTDCFCLWCAFGIKTGIAGTLIWSRQALDTMKLPVLPGAFFANGIKGGCIPLHRGPPVVL